MDYVAYQRAKWEAVDRDTLRQFAGRKFNGFPPRRHFGGGLGQDVVADTGEPVISVADMEAAKAPAKALYGDFGISSVSDMKSLAKQIGEDRDLLMKTWPATGHCTSVAAIIKIRDELGAFVFKLDALTQDLRNKGITRAYVGEAYDRAFNTLRNDWYGKWGFGPINNALWPIIEEYKKNAGLPWTDDKYERGTISLAKAVEIGLDDQPACMDRNQAGGGIRERVIFILGAVARFFETIAFLEDIRPWFLGIVDFVWEVFATIGEYVWAVSKKVGAAFDIIPDSLAAMADIASKAAGMIGKLIKYSMYGGVAFLLWWLLLKKDKKKGHT